MIALLFLLLVFLHGLVISKSFFKTNKSINAISGFIFGSIFCISAIYWTACLTKSLNSALVLFFFFSIQLVLIFSKNYILCVKELTLLEKRETFIFICLFSFCYWLFAKTFGYDSTHGNLLIASNIYMDFGAHIPFIRSFSMGNNFPGEVPFFQNSGLLYYFLFDFYTGILEHLGLRVDIAYNLLSALSLTAVLLLLHNLGQVIFKSRAVGILSAVFFLFNSDLSFFTFFQKSGLRLQTISSWWHNNLYLEGVPTFLNKNISIPIFLNLDTYMNQRHFIFGVAFFLLFLYFFLSNANKHKVKTATAILLGVFLGFVTFWHTMIFIALYFVSIMLLILYKSIRKTLVITLLIGIIIGTPQLIAIKLHSSATILFLQPQQRKKLYLCQI